MEETDEARLKPFVKWAGGKTQLLKPIVALSPVAFRRYFEPFIVKAGFVKDKTYFKEMNASDLEERAGIDLSALTGGGTAEKRFDFVILKDGISYGIECNFYSSNGSKLYETARSYKELAEEAEDVKGFGFIWVTDGKGWDSAKNALKETFDVLGRLWDIADLISGAFDSL
jgi:type II restriction enzyme